MGQNNFNLSNPDATSLLSAMRLGTLSAEQVVRQHLERLARTQGKINGATHIFTEQALAEARELDRHGNKDLPLFGLPCSVKETFCMAGQDVTAGSMRMQPEHHLQDAEVVRRLRQAGAVIIARSNIPEFAMTGESTNLRFGRTNNPLDVDRVAGGSSGGEGALVGSGASAFGVGSDILGSIRIPAAFCGVVGFKPHSGGVDKTGTWPVVTGNTRTWLGIGPLTRSVRDAQLVYNVITDHPVAEPARTGGRLITPHGFPLRVQQGCISDALSAARTALLEQSFTEERRAFTDIGSLYLKIPKLILDDFHHQWLDMLSHPPGRRFSLLNELVAQLRGKPTIDRGLLMWLLIAPFMKPRSRKQVQAVARQFDEARAHYQSLLGEDGILVLPTLGLLAPRHGEMNRLSLKPGINGLFTGHTMGNYLDLPSIAIPAWKFRDPATGLPPSISVLCAPGAEAKLFEAAKCIESVLN
ncbi:amidase [Duganella sp. LX20W]|uniref:Amidase n=1 Tax=Rugamonas brunnea TaxID=2758569 RepID=A0A7W2ENW6_9BURK|nr:amidase [Rugamonas brunnea]MBA5635941.1 amidase [Rugamonas brunnea]